MHNDPAGLSGLWFSPINDSMISGITGDRAAVIPPHTELSTSVAHTHNKLPGLLKTGSSLRYVAEPGARVSSVEIKSASLVVCVFEIRQKIGFKFPVVRTGQTDE